MQRPAPKRIRRAPSCKPFAAAAEALDDWIGHQSPDATAHVSPARPAAASVPLSAVASAMAIAAASLRPALPRGASPVAEPGPEERPAKRRRVAMAPDASPPAGGVVVPRALESGDELSTGSESGDGCFDHPAEPSPWYRYLSPHVGTSPFGEGLDGLPDFVLDEFGVIPGRL